MKHDCKQEVVIEIVVSDIREIKKDVKSLLKYKWQIMGGSSVIGVLIAALVIVVGWFI